MNIDLTDTTSSQINSALVKARRAIGSPAVGMVLTLVIVTDEGNHYDALKAANEASKEHPSRILTVILRPGRSPRARESARLDAEVRVGGETGSGETVLLRLHGKLAQHAQSVVLPLLLPDAPVVVWWPENAPASPADDPLGHLAQRRITDAAATEDPVGTLTLRAGSYTPGDTDLAWTRITPWRSVLAAALDQRHSKITGAVVEGEGDNPSTELLALWLAERLDIPVQRVISEGPGLSGVRLHTQDGDICLDRANGSMAELAMPGQPDRHVALKRRDTAELMAEELRRLDPDEMYGCTVRFGERRSQDERPPAGHGPGRASSAPTPASAGPDPANPDPANPDPANPDPANPASAGQAGEGTGVAGGDPAKPGGSGRSSGGKASESPAASGYSAASRQVTVRIPRRGSSHQGRG